MRIRRMRTRLGRGSPAGRRRCKSGRSSGRRRARGGLRRWRLRAHLGREKRFHKGAFIHFFGLCSSDQRHDDQTATSPIHIHTCTKKVSHSFLLFKEKTVSQTGDIGKESKAKNRKTSSGKKIHTLLFLEAAYKPPYICTYLARSFGCCSSSVGDGGSIAARNWISFFLVLPITCSLYAPSDSIAAKCKYGYACPFFCCFAPKISFSFSLCV